MNIKGQSGQMVWIILAVLLLVFYLTYTGAIKFGGVGAITPPAGGAAPVGTGQLLSCPSVATTASVRVRGSLATAASWLANTVVITAKGSNNVIASDTTTGTPAGPYLSITVPCTQQIYNNPLNAIAVANAANNSVKSGDLSYGGGTAIQVSLDGSQSVQLNITPRNSALSNTSTTTTQITTESAATAMDAGNTRNGYIDFDLRTANSTYGGPESNGLVWIIDTVDSAAFSDKAISLSLASGPPGFTLTETNCANYPKPSSVDSGNRCYVSPRIKISDGIIRVSWTMVADGGANPGPTSDPILYIEDLQYFQDVDGTIKYDAMTSGGTDVGQSQNKFTWNND